MLCMLSVCSLYALYALCMLSTHFHTNQTYINSYQECDILPEHSAVTGVFLTRTFKVYIYGNQTYPFFMSLTKSS
jgi:hypothetical protein